MSPPNEGRRALLGALLAAVALPSRARMAGRPSYAARSEVQAFIDEVAQQHGFERARVERWLDAARYSEAVERLIAFYRRERAAGETAPAFFQRVDLARVTEEIEDLQRLTEADAVPLDFVDLAESSDFAPEVMDGECSA